MLFRLEEPQGPLRCIAVLSGSPQTSHIPLGVCRDGADLRPGRSKVPGASCEDEAAKGVGKGQVCAVGTCVDIWYTGLAIFLLAFCLYLRVKGPTLGSNEYGNLPLCILWRFSLPYLLGRSQANDNLFACTVDKEPHLLQ
jgi:hypothetical protein